MPVAGKQGNIQFKQDNVLGASSEFTFDTGTTYVGIGIDPLTKFHLYGKQSGGTENEFQMGNTLTIDGIESGDKNLVYSSLNDPKWAEQMYRDENGEYLYIYNFQTQREVGR